MRVWAFLIENDVMWEKTFEKISFKLTFVTKLVKHRILEDILCNIVIAATSTTVNCCQLKLTDITEAKPYFTVDDLLTFVFLDVVAEEGSK